MNPDLVFDVGANNGDDTAYYLGEGFRVVAIEANPVLVRRMKQRFSPEIDAGTLVVLHVGIWQSDGESEFFINDSNDEHSSFVQSVGGRDGSVFHTEKVSTRRFESVLDEYGCPFYLKIDIETADIHCLKGLRARRDTLPRYISIEAHSLDYLAELYCLGYREFKVVDQSGHNRPRAFDNETRRGRVAGWIEHQARRFDNHFGGARKFPIGSSGPFGEDTPGDWQELATVAYDWLHYANGQRKRGGLNMRGWYDFHARLDS